MALPAVLASVFARLIRPPMPTVPLPPEFVDAIRANPDDDAPRLAAADWWTENGEEDRGEFVRVQCRLARMARGVAGRGVNAHKADLRRERKLLLARGRAWIGREVLPPNPYDAPYDREHFVEPPEVTLVRGWHCEANETCHFARGFIEHVTCPAAAALAHLDALLGQNPLRRVRLTTMIGRRFRSSGCYQIQGDDRWFTEADVAAARRPEEDDFEVDLPLLRCRFPGIEFELPPEGRRQNRDFAFTVQGVDEVVPWTQEQLDAATRRFGIPPRLVGATRP